MLKSQFVKQFSCLLLYFVLTIFSFCGCAGDRIIQTLEDEIWAENFTHYRLQREGCLKLELHSLKGDVDVYISTEDQHPSFNSYELKSETCGVDVVHIPSSMKRPVYISVYGHPYYLQSAYKLVIYDVPESVIDDYEQLVAKYERYYFDEMYKKNDGAGPEEGERMAKASRPNTEEYGNTVEDEMPVWWKILLGILEFGIESSEERKKYDTSIVARDFCFQILRSLDNLCFVKT